MNMKRRVSKQVPFDAAHRLMDYDGKCANVHGHRWIVEATAEDEGGSDFVIDFVNLKKLLNEIVVDKFDHKMVNDIEPFIVMNPTAENLAEYFLLMLHKAEPKVVEVAVWETPTSCARVRI